MKKYNNAINSIGSVNNNVNNNAEINDIYITE